MKVKELIQLLEERNPESWVYVFCSEVDGLDKEIELEIESVFDFDDTHVGLNCTE
jgi:hypothetical protein